MMCSKQLDAALTYLINTYLTLYPLSIYHYTLSSTIFITQTFK